MNPTIEQANVTQFTTTNLTEHVIVEARAGTGKTSLLKMIVIPLYKMGRKVAVFVFNNEIQREIDSKIGKYAEVRTSHSFAFGVLKQAGKYFIPKEKRGQPRQDWLSVGMEYVEHINPLSSRDQEKVSQDRMAIKDLVHFTRVTLTDYKDEKAIHAMAIDRGIKLGDMPNENIHVASRLLIAHEKLLRQDGRGHIDFDDMLWLPIIWDLEFPQYDDVCIDEAQDTAAVTREVYARAAKRVIIVGDQFQAIYSFAGADNDSLLKLKERFNCKSFPLTINWRCPKSVIIEAQKLIPDIQYHDGAPNGAVGYCGKEYLYKNVKLGDMIICRRNAPNAPICIRLIKEGKKAYIKGRDIGKEMINMIKNVDKVVNRHGIDFEDALESWSKEEEKRMIKRKYKATTIDALFDKVEVIQTFLSEGLNSKEVSAKIQNIFKDSFEWVNGKKVETPGICLSSVHRQKGGEAKTVWIIDIKNIRINREDMTQDEREQEMHLEYVAKTRAMERMLYVDLEREGDELEEIDFGFETETETKEEELKLEPLTMEKLFG